MAKIIAAAVRIRGVTLSMPPPARHYNIVNTLCETLGIPEQTRYASPQDQGFLTDGAEFVSRKKAKRIARAAGQLKTDTHYEELYSEDLW